MKDKKRGYILRPAIDVMTRRIGLFILTILLSVVSFVLIYIVFMIYSNYSISDTILKEATNYGKKESYVMKLTIFEDGLENVNQFSQELNEKGIKTGRIYSSGIDGGIQEIYCMDSGYADYISFTAGGKELDFDNEQDSYYSAYVGIAYAELYPVGSEFVVGEEIYKVKGVLDKEQLLIIAPDGNQLYDGMPSEYVIVGEASNTVNSNRLYVFSDVNENNLRKMINDTAEKFDYGYMMSSIYSCVQDNHEQDIEESKIVIVLGYILLAITFVVICVVSVSSVFMNSPMYAVLYAFGYGHKDIYRIILIENGVRMLVSVMVAFALSSIYMLKAYGSGYASFVRNTVIRTYTLYGGGILLVTGIVIFIVSSIIPVLIFRKISINSLLKNKE